MRSIGRSSAAFLARFRASVRGGVAIWTAVALPPLAVLSVGAVELGSISADKSKLQDAADAAALAGARELGFAGPNGVTERAQRFALTQADAVARRQTVTATAVLNREGARYRGVTVTLRARRMSFFGNLLPPGGFHTAVDSTASTLGETPLCVVGLRSSAENIKLTDASRITATGCMVQSNGNVTLDALSRINAGEVQVTGTATGTITPSALTGAPPLPDPFSNTSTYPMGSFVCTDTTDYKLDNNQTATVPPGTHCGNFDIKGNAVLTLAPGVHRFREVDLKIDGNARLVGDGVVLIFDRKSRLEAKGAATIDLQGARTGEWAGFVIVGHRDNSGATAGEDFTLDTPNIDRIEGVIYLPTSKLRVDAGLLGGLLDQVGERSNWTVTIVNHLEVKKNTQLVINTNYSASTVPRPPGVGDSQPTGTRLTR